MLNKVLGLVDLHNDVSLGQLTENRPQAVTTILCRYTFIDFILSCFTNSEIDDIAVLVKDHGRNIAKHISRDSTYLKNSKTGFLSMLVNEYGAQNPLYNTDINNLKENDYLLYDNESDYVIVAPVHFLLDINFQEILEKHIEKGADCSLVYKETSDVNMFSGCEKVVIDAIGNAQKFLKIQDKDKNSKFNVNLDIYIFNRDFFDELIRESSKVSDIYSIKDMIKYYNKMYNKVNCIPFTKEVMCFNSFQKYFKNQMLLLEQGEDNIFLKAKDIYIYTTTHNSRPVLYGEHADVSSSILANGSSIAGTVKNSILARDVVVEDGASVENCILFSHTVVKSGVHLKNVVANKRCVFKSSTHLEGTFDEPLYIKGGSII